MSPHARPPATCLVNALFLVICLFTVATAEAAEFSVEQHPGRVTVNLDGKLFTEYLTKVGTKPILWPVIGPTGQPMTRAYPMEDVAGEKHDHPHQRSLWFTHGDVNGIDFWSEPISYKSGKVPADKRFGSIVHRDFLVVEARDGKAVIRTANDWVDAQDKKQCEDVRTVTCSVEGDARIIDFDITIKAVPAAVTFGDTKEGCFGIRIATSMDVDSKPGGKIVNSDGQTDKTAWGKPARWVDYHGPVDGQQVGIAVLNHPSSFRYPTHWHVRTYGLFAANPFGLHDFDPKIKTGAFTLDAGKTIALSYRVVLHRGDEKSADIPAAFDRYSATKR
ncbi:MAG TPA: PmoA family protein [Pirellulales bacterium]|nr:PmoA family protein [Pirellulales bacterium]